MKKYIMWSGVLHEDVEVTLCKGESSCYNCGRPLKEYYKVIGVESGIHHFDLGKKCIERLS